MKVTFLGTSAGMPTPERSLPALCLEREGEVLLFDCGEGTQVQLRRAAVRTGKLSTILISHLHGDHVTGLMGLLMTLGSLDREEPLPLYGPPGLSRYVSVSAQLLQVAWRYETPVFELEAPGVAIDRPGYQILCDWLEHRAPTLGFALRERERPGEVSVERAAAVGLSPGPLLGALQRGEPVTAPSGRRVLPEEVVGPPRPGRRFCYCADTRPCDAALRLAEDADLLVHEGTFAADLAEDARAKGHSTVTEAARIALQAGAHRLGITHISPRYPDPEVLRRQAAEVFANCFVASDLQTAALPLRR